MTKKVILKSPKSRKDVEEYTRALSPLNEELKKTGFSRSLRRLLEAYTTRNISAETLDLQLSQLAQSSYTGILSVLTKNDLQLIEGLRQSDLPSNVTNLLADLVSEYGPQMEDFPPRLRYPNDWNQVSWRPDSWDLSREELVLSLTLIKNNNEKLLLEGPVSSYLILVRSLLRKMVRASKRVNKSIPTSKVKLNKKTIGQIKEFAGEIERIAK